MKSLITLAIQKRQLLRMIYQFQVRIIEPHALGLTKDHLEALLCWQVSPPMLEGGEWRLFYLDWIANLRMLEHPVSSPPAGKSPPMDSFSAIYTTLPP